MKLIDKLNMIIKGELEVGHAFTEGNKDDVKEAVASLDRFTKNWCMNCKETEEKNDLVFRCSECVFEEGGNCLIKEFKEKHYSEYKDFGCMGDL